MSDGKNHRRPERKRKGEKPPRCTCACHSILTDYIHRDPCCHPRNVWWIMRTDEFDQSIYWEPNEPL